MVFQINLEISTVEIHYLTFISYHLFPRCSQACNYENHLNKA